MVALDGGGLFVFVVESSLDLRLGQACCTRVVGTIVEAAAA